MENTTNNSFEEQWQKAFEDASLPPSEVVWEKIELGLGTTTPPKSGNGSYYIGAISTIILGVILWFFMSRENKEKLTQIVESKVIVPENKIEDAISKTEERFTVKLKEKTPIKKVFTTPKEEVIKPITEPEIITQMPETQKREITDSVDFISPIMMTKKVNSDLINPTINIPFEQTPYYEIPKSKPKKKTIWDKVRISGGVGIY